MQDRPLEPTGDQNATAAPSGTFGAADGPLNIVDGEPLRPDGPPPRPGQHNRISRRAS